MMKQEDDLWSPSLEKRIILLESKMFILMATNDELIAKVESLEKEIKNKDENIQLLSNHSKKQDEKMSSLRSMFKDILDESENLAFSFALLEQKERNIAENSRAIKNDVEKINVAIRNQSKEFEIKLSHQSKDYNTKIDDIYNEILGQFSTSTTNLEYAMEEIAAKERAWDEKMDKADKRMTIIGNLNKKILGDMVRKTFKI